jgi:hypothetical protein
MNILSDILIERDGKQTQTTKIKCNERGERHFDLSNKIVHSTLHYAWSEVLNHNSISTVMIGAFYLFREYAEGNLSTFVSNNSE